MPEKVFRETNVQIGILRSRGVIVKNKKRAKNIIRKINYYNLINGYKDPFLQKDTLYERYLPGTTIEEIYALYEFDRNPRILTIEYILEIEKHVKSIVSYCFSKEHGHKDYLSIDNFDTRGKNKCFQVYGLISKLYGEIANNVNKEPSMKHYINGKNYVPLWVLVNAMSMGEISKFYANMIQKERSEVCKRVRYGIREDELESYLFFLSSVRNRCAHDERLFSYLSYVDIPQNNYLRYFRIDKKRNNYFAVITAFKALLSKSRFEKFQVELDQLINILDSRLKVISFKSIGTMMGIPGNWKKISKLE